MQELDDSALLREYVERDSEEAFAALVTRHVNKVYSVALRLTGNPHSAEEITQAVFVILAKKSRQLGKRVILSGWLYQTARLTAVTFIRGGIRRARREQEACMQTALNENESDLSRRSDTEADAIWKQFAPLLDAAMAGLNETDRHAVVLRFFDGKSLREVGAALGANEDAAKKRVSRALEKLRSLFRQTRRDADGHGHRRGDFRKFRSSRAGGAGGNRYDDGGERNFDLGNHNNPGERNHENDDLDKTQIRGGCGHGGIAGRWRGNGGDFSNRRR